MTRNAIAWASPGSAAAIFSICEPSERIAGMRHVFQQCRRRLKTALNYCMAGEEWDLQALKLGTDDVRAHAQYRNDHDTVPLTDSIRTLPVSDTQSARMQSMGRDGANVLLDDYWDMYKALIS